MIDYSKIKPYVKAIRPALVDSFPEYSDRELNKIERFTTTLLQALFDLNARLEALETP